MQEGAAQLPERRRIAIPTIAFVAQAVLPAKLGAHFAVVQSMNSTAKNTKAALNVIGCLALLHAIRSHKTPKRTRLRNTRTASA